MTNAAKQIFNPGKCNPNFFFLSFLVLSGTMPKVLWYNYAKGLLIHTAVPAYDLNEGLTQPPAQPGLNARENPKLK